MVVNAVSFADVAEVYRKTATRLQKIGWIQNHGKTSRGECLQQALWAVCNEKYGNSRTIVGYCACNSCLAIPGGDFEEICKGILAITRTPNIPEWNDVGSRTVADVLALLEQCAVVAEQKAAEQAVAAAEQQQRMNQVAKKAFRQTSYTEVFGAVQLEPTLPLVPPLPFDTFDTWLGTLTPTLVTVGV